MKYISTRGQVEAKNFCDILLGGLAPDGGLYLPEQYPQIGYEKLNTWRKLSYAELATEILALYIDDISISDLSTIIKRTYTAETFSYGRFANHSYQITPITRLSKNLYLLELANGPTLAFKDMAMQLLGNLFEYVLLKQDGKLNILGATSGDTGSAAEYALRGKNNISVFMLSPKGKMSQFQRAQMYSLQEDNIHNLAVNTLFDGCQDIVKQISNDADFKQKHNIGVINSINWARIVAQVVYYFKAYLDVTEKQNEMVSFAVPTGNFGNICAGYIAKKMGLPIDELILATNENDVLDEFFRSGRYRPRSSAEITSSPSMDISKASNFERFMFELVGRDSEKIRELWVEVDAGKPIDISKTPYMQELKNEKIVSGSSRHQDRIQAIRTGWQEFRVLIDTHTADALKVGIEYFQPETNKLVVLETAQAVKFADTIRTALNIRPPCPVAYEKIEEQPQRVKELPAETQQIKDYISHNAIS